MGYLLKGFLGIACLSSSITPSLQHIMGYALKELCLEEAHLIRCLLERWLNRLHFIEHLPKLSADVYEYVDVEKCMSDCMLVFFEVFQLELIFPLILLSFGIILEALAGFVASCLTS